MKTIHFVLNYHWFELTKAGKKPVEYRAITPRWTRLILARREEIGFVRFSRGYTSETITRRVTKIDVGPCPLPGWPGMYIRIHSEPLRPEKGATPAAANAKRCLAIREASRRVDAAMQDTQPSGH